MLPPRDLGDEAGAARRNSVACCGHDPRTRIAALAFQPDGDMLVRAPGSGGAVLWE